MDYSYVVQKKQNHLEIQFSGSLVGEAIVFILEDISWHEVRSSQAGLLWDLRDADLTAYSFTDITRLQTYDAEEVSRVSATSARLMPGRKFSIAGVFGSSSDHLILRLWEAVTTEAEDLERRSFSNIEDARRWIAGE